MIPSYLDSTVSSNAERKLYKLFQESHQTEDWTVIHSLGYRKGIKHPFGEIDFIVLIPNHGIFVLEVKGGRVSCTDGIWSYTDRYGNVTTKNKSPFAQVRDNMFKLKEIIREIDSSKSFAKCSIFSGVMFPDIVFDVDSVEAHPREIFDLRDNGDIVQYIKKLEEYGRLNIEKYNVGHISLCKEDIDLVVKKLRPNFDISIPLIAQIDRTRQSIKELTEEQYDALDTIDCNMRTVVSGFAGTGKTVLAIEIAKKYFYKNYKTAFFCFNKKLAAWAEDIFAKAGISLSFVGTIHSYLQKTVGKKIRFYDSPDYYRRDLPAAFLQVVLHDKFDAIVIDEAQDILCCVYIDVLNHLLKDGLSDGRFVMFGDFNYQNLYQQSTLNEARNYLYCKSQHMNFPLKKNCRNSKNIHRLAVDSFGIDEKDWKTSAEVGPDVGMHIAKSDIVSDVEILLEQLLNSGINKEDILLLSPFSYYGSSASKIKKYNISTDSTTDGISFMTIASSKGLERDVVVLLDINEKISAELMYVAFTRAKVMLHIFGNNIAIERIMENELWQKSEVK